MCTRSKRKWVFAVVKYRLACWLNMVVFVNHIWRRGSSIEHTESTPKGFEGISDFGFLSEAFFRKNYSDFSTTLPSVWSSPQWKCRPEMEETAWKIRDINHWNENFRWKANKGPFAALRRYRGRRDLRHASRRWWRQRLQKGRQCKKTVVDHTFTETHALRKTRNANPAETKPFSSCLQKKFTWVSKTRHIWRHGWKWRICLHDRRWQAAKLQSQENRWKWWTTPAHRSIAWTNVPSGSYTNGRFHKPPSAEFSPTDHPHF